MANKKGKINLNYNLKDKSEELTLVYLISGQPTQKGMYIQSGKKVIVK